VDALALAHADAGAELPEELAELVAERTGGNPYFVKEAIRDLRERGALARENGSAVLVRDASIPAALQGVLQARLDSLDAEARELITTAAVVGRSFGLPRSSGSFPARDCFRPSPSSSGSSSWSRSGAGLHPSTASATG
jgi:hypothetical protein